MSELTGITELKKRVGPCGDMVESITHNEEYLRKHFGPAVKKEERYGKMSEEEIKETAVINAIVSKASCITQWDIDSARRIAYEILEDVNDHSCAALVEETLKKCRG